MSDARAMQTDQRRAGLETSLVLAAFFLGLGGGILLGALPMMMGNRPPN